MYIVLEGIVGSGKSTQAKRLVEYFTSPQPSPKGEEVQVPCPFSGGEGVRGGGGCIYVREPGSTPIAEDIRHLAQSKEWIDETMHPLTNAYLYAAARAQTLNTIVAPALSAGKIVVSDRCFLSSCSIQGEAQGVGINRVLWINKEAVGKVLPDIILYLDVDVDTALARTSDEVGDKFEREGREFYQKIIRGYEKCAKWKKLEGRFHCIDANASEDEVFARILRQLDL